MVTFIYTNALQHEISSNIINELCRTATSPKIRQKTNIAANEYTLKPIRSDFQIAEKILKFHTELLGKKLLFKIDKDAKAKAVWRDVNKELHSQDEQKYTTVVMKYFQELSCNQN